MQVKTMSVELLDTSRFHGYRVRRQINGQTYQEYFSLKENGKRLRGARRQAVKAVASARDEVLAKKQEAAQKKAALERMFDKEGNVRGILLRLKTEKSGTQTPVIQIGIMSLTVNKIVNTTVSVNSHGLKGAWERAVDFYAKHKKISKRSKVYKKLLSSCPAESKLKSLMRK